jgi:flavin reductase (DIM6/NTAB) family NADH-FMN oxidoreductase RutF
MSDFIEMRPEDIRDNPFKLIGGDWMLITAGTIKSFNMMTASWGAMGVLWDKNVAFCFVRPTRHTFEFMNKAETYTLSFFDEQYRSVLTYCGSHSGKHVNKLAHCGITPIKGSIDDVYFAESRLVLECRKIYVADINPSAFLAQTLVDIYPEKDYHRMFIGEIVKVLGREVTKMG